MSRETEYKRAREKSERIKQDAYAAANQLAVDCIETADTALKKDPFSPVARAARDRAYSAASDARAGMYAEAEQRHANRMAALARYFGQAYRGPGNPDADHALAFVAEVDPNGLWTPFVAEPPIGEIATIEFAGIKPQRRVDAPVVSSPRTPLQPTDGRTAALSRAIQKRSWRPSEPASACCRRKSWPTSGPALASPSRRLPLPSG
jgi:hypothetical protein